MKIFTKPTTYSLLLAMLLACGVDPQEANAGNGAATTTPDTTQTTDKPDTTETTTKPDTSDTTTKPDTTIVPDIDVVCVEQKVEAENYSELSGQNITVKNIDNKTTTNQKITDCANGSWVRFDSVDLSSGGYKSVKVRTAAKDMKNIKYVEVFEVGSSDKLIAKIDIPCTNNSEDYIITSAMLQHQPTTVADIELRFTCENGATVDVDWVQFAADDLTKKTKSLVDFFLPMEPQGEMISSGIWGDPNVLPRDINNGIEDSKLDNWCYWDGGIVKDDEGKYHIYCSRWGQNFPHSTGWKEDSKGIHAVSDNIMGPYKDQGVIFPYRDNGKGSNVYGLRLHDGRYAVVTSEITQGEIHVADNPNGPFEYLGQIQVDLNGYPKGIAFYTHPTSQGQMSNVQIRSLDGGGYVLIARSTALMYSEKDILGPYKVMTDRVYQNVDELAKNYNEDPTMWVSGGISHIVYNHWPSKTSHHFTSEDGVTNWVYRGEAFSRSDTKIFKYTNGTVNDWVFVERPTAYIEDGHVTHFIFSVIDVHKGNDGPNDNHASKIVVVPFDGKAFDDYMQSVIAAEKNK